MPKMTATWTIDPAFDQTSSTIVITRRTSRSIVQASFSPASIATARPDSWSIHGQTIIWSRAGALLSVCCWRQLHAEKRRPTFSMLFSYAPSDTPVSYAGDRATRQLLRDAWHDPRYHQLLLLSRLVRESLLSADDARALADLAPAAFAERCQQVWDDGQALGRAITLLGGGTIEHVSPAMVPVGDPWDAMRQASISAVCRQIPIGPAIHLHLQGIVRQLPETL